MDTTKTCTKCNKDKGLDEFHPHKLGKNGLNPQCKTCKSEYNKARRKANHAAILQREQELRDRRGDELKEYNRRYREQNKESFNAASTRYHKSSPIAQIANPLRCRIYKALNGISKHATTTVLLGCSIEEFRDYLESQFTEDMSWDNYGVDGWSLDHILPCSAFDLTNPRHQRYAFHWSNCQPMLVADNASKRDKYCPDELEAYLNSKLPTNLL